MGPVSGRSRSSSSSAIIAVQGVSDQGTRIPPFLLSRILLRTSCNIRRMSWITAWFPGPFGSDDGFVYLFVLKMSAAFFSKYCGLALQLKERNQTSEVVIEAH